MFRKLLSSKTWSIDLGLLLVRLACGLMAIHGWSKFQHFAERSEKWPDPFHVTSPVSLGLTVFAELICTIFLAAGLYTRLALIPLIICMGTAAFVIHANDSFAEREHALLFLLPYLALMFTGPGKYSADHWLRRA